MRIGIATLLLVACALSGCDDGGEQAREAEAAKAKRVAELTAAGDAARKEERRIMSNPTSAVDELGRRIDEWLSTTPGGPVLVTEKRTRWIWSYALPSTTPWVLRCGRIGGVELTIGNLVEGDDGTTANVIQKNLTRAGFSEEQCAKVLQGLSQKLRLIFSGS